MAIAFVQSVHAQTPSAATCASPAITTTAGNDIVVAIAISDIFKSVSSIADGVNTYTFRAEHHGTVRTEIWTAHNTLALSAGTITVNISSSGAGCAAIFAEYSGIGAIGTTNSAFSSGGLTTATISLTTQDANNWVATSFGKLGASTYASSVGNLRDQFVSVTTVVNVALNDNTAASASAVVNTVTYTPAEAWDAAAVELRVGAPAGAAVADLQSPASGPSLRI
jgi:hypothetical protein